MDALPINDKYKLCLISFVSVLEMRRKLLKRHRIQLLCYWTPEGCQSTMTVVVVVVGIVVTIFEICLRLSFV